MSSTDKPRTRRLRHRGGRAATTVDEPRHDGTNLLEPLHGLKHLSQVHRAREDDSTT